MIAEFTQNLVDKLKAVPALSGRVGLALAGGPNDTAMQNAPLPAAWVRFDGAYPMDTDINGNLCEDIVFEFTALLMISYKTDGELINTSLPVLDACAQAVSGHDSTDFGLRWKYQGAQLVDIFSDRLVYEVRFAVSSSYIVS